MLVEYNFSRFSRKSNCGNRCGLLKGVLQLCKLFRMTSSLTQYGLYSAVTSSNVAQSRQSCYRSMQYKNVKDRS